MATSVEARFLAIRLPQLLLLLLLLLTIASTCPTSVSAAKAGLSRPQCLDPDGKSVDWWIIVKAGQNITSGSSGFQYAYFDAHMDKLATKRLKIASDSIGSISSPVGRTLRQVYEDTAKMSELGWAQYNDQTPSGSTSTYYAHAKGALAFGSSGGFWLIHSVPSFTAGFTATSEYSYPSSGASNGQTMLCLSLDIGEIDDVVADQLSYSNPQFYDSNVPSSLRVLVPRLVAVLGGQTKTSSPASNIRTLTTSNRVAMRSFAKNAKWGQDLYGILVAPNLHSPLLVETWMRPTEPSCCAPSVNCTSYSVTAVNMINLGNGIIYAETKDHAKWATTSDNSKPWTCIGDINFNYSQYKRGGGTVCLQSANVHAAFQAIIAGTDSYCSKR